MLPFTFVYAPIPYTVQFLPQYSYVPTYFSQNHTWNSLQNSLNSNSYNHASINSQDYSTTLKPQLLKEKSLICEQNHSLKNNQQNSVQFPPIKCNQVVVKKGQAKQKFGRNIMSNIFLMMVRFIHKNKKMRSYIERIIQTYNMSIKISEFYNMIKRKISKLPPYATQTIIRSFWNSTPSGNTIYNIKERQFSIIFRIIGKLYLNTYHMPYVYNTKKIKLQSKKLHQIYTRTFLQL